MAAAAVNAVKRGSCLCRAVTFSLTGAPARNIQCNCLNCQKSSGSAFSTNILYKLDQYKIESGAQSIRIYQDKDTQTGGILERAFCSICGSNLSMRNTGNPKMKDNIVIPAGTIDNAYKEFVPQSELFPHRRHGWVQEVKKPEKKSKI